MLWSPLRTNPSFTDKSKQTGEFLAVIKVMEIIFPFLQHLYGKL